MNTWARSFCSLLLAVPMSLPAALVADDEAVFSQGELEQILAPVALYPDSVLTHVLIASTYPLEVVQAARWSRDNPGLEGEAAVAAVEHMDWDDSVKALVAFPDLLQRMNEDLEWTQRLGDAFLLQEAQVLNAVQGLRQRADAAGHLEALEHARVYREPETIIIEPAVREVVYLPYYDTRVVYGSWGWPAYPPVYWAYPYGYYPGTEFYWGPAIHIWPRFHFASFYWPHRHVVVHHHHHHHHHHHARRDSGGQRWRHDPRHRRGVSYAHHRLNREYGRGGVRHDRDWSARGTGGQDTRRPSPPAARDSQRGSREDTWRRDHRDPTQLEAVAGDWRRGVSPPQSRTTPRAGRTRPGTPRDLTRAVREAPPGTVQRGRINPPATDPRRGDGLRDRGRVTAPPAADTSRDRLPQQPGNRAIGRPGSPLVAPGRPATIPRGTVRREAPVRQAPRPDTVTRSPAPASPRAVPPRSAVPRGMPPRAAPAPRQSAPAPRAAPSPPPQQSAPPAARGNAPAPRAQLSRQGRADGRHGAARELKRER